MCSDLDENPPPEQRGRLGSPDSGPNGRLRADAGLKNAVAKPAEPALNHVSVVAVRVGAYSVQRFGTQPSYPTSRDELPGVMM